MNKKIKILLLVGFGFLFSNFYLNVVEAEADIYGDVTSYSWLVNDTSYSLLVEERRKNYLGELEFVKRFCVQPWQHFRENMFNEDNGETFWKVFILKDDGMVLCEFSNQKVEYNYKLVLSKPATDFFRLEYRPC